MITAYHWPHPLRGASENEITLPKRHETRNKGEQPLEAEDDLPGITVLDQKASMIRHSSAIAGCWKSSAYRYSRKRSPADPRYSTASISTAAPLGRATTPTAARAG
jgi:hypothetical protein